MAVATGVDRAKGILELFSNEFFLQTDHRGPTIIFFEGKWILKWIHWLIHRNPATRAAKGSFEGDFLGIRPRGCSAAGRLPVPGRPRGKLRVEGVECVGTFF